MVANVVVGATTFGLPDPFVKVPVADKPEITTENRTGPGNF